MAQSDKDRIGFVGLGIMGRPMAGHLVDAGYETTVFDLLPDAVGQLESKGAVAGSSPADVAAPVGHYHHDGAGLAARRGGDCGTWRHLGGRGPRLGRDRHEHDFAHGRPKAGGHFEAADVEMLDAPVTAARQAQSTGASPYSSVATPTCRAVPAGVAGPRRRGNPHGAGRLGHTAKLANQVLGIGCTIGICEGLVLASKAGLDLNKFLTAAMNGASTSWHLEYLGPRILKGDFSPRIHGAPHAERPAISAGSRRRSRFTFANGGVGIESLQVAAGPRRGSYEPGASRPYSGHRTVSGRASPGSGRVGRDLLTQNS